MASVFQKKKYYFKGFPKVSYTLGEKETQVLDFVHRWAFRKSIIENASAWSKWILRDQDTLFSVAKALYGSEYYYWIVMMMNNMLDPIFDYPLNESDLYSFVQKKYGAENVYSVHHYEADADSNIYSVPPGTIVSADYATHAESGTTRNIVQITNFVYEARLNEEKRAIRLLKPEFLQIVIREKDLIVSSEFGRKI
jgi:hypothetical protein